MSGVHFAGVLPFLVGKTETAGLQPQDQKDLQDGDVGHELRHNAVLHLGERTGVNGHEQEVQYPGQDGTETVNGSFSCQLFQGICHIEYKFS